MNPIHEYVKFLTTMGNLEETTVGSYKVTKKISVPRTMDENEKLEMIFYSEYKKILEKESREQVQK